ncbi:MAG: F-box protein [Chlamydiota bacterium]|nr:F-box protein [Chlamydiota bacterium]
MRTIDHKMMPSPIGETFGIQKKLYSINVLPEEILLKIFECLVVQSARDLTAREITYKNVHCTYRPLSELKGDVTESFIALKKISKVSRRFYRVATTETLWELYMQGVQSGRESRRSYIHNFVTQLCSREKKIVHLHAKKSIYPFDSLIARIERSLDDRVVRALQWQLEYEYLERGDTLYRRLKCLSSLDFKLCFGRDQGRIGEGYTSNYAGGVSSIHIPMLKVRTKIYSDLLGAIIVYTGKDWEKDKDWFFNSDIDGCERPMGDDIKNTPPKYLWYKLVSFKHEEKIQNYYVRTLDDPSHRLPVSAWHRQLIPTPEGLPRGYSRDGVFDDITKFLQEEVWERIIEVKPEAKKLEKFELEKSKDVAIRFGVEMQA